MHYKDYSQDWRREENLCLIACVTVHSASVCVCLCVCVYVCLCACVCHDRWHHIFICNFVQVMCAVVTCETQCTQKSTCKCVFVRVPVCLCVCVYACVLCVYLLGAIIIVILSISSMHPRYQAEEIACMLASVFWSVCVCVCVCMCVCVCVGVCTLNC